MDFKGYLQTSANQVDQILDQILIEFLNEVKKEKPKLIPFALGLINSCRGGKRIRGVLIKLGYELTRSVIPDSIGDPYYIDSRFRGNDNKEILRISAAIEILHAAILVHDDVIDQSPTRRGQPALYKALGGNHYGISQAISIGDIGLYLPIKIIAGSSFDSDLKIKAISHLSQTIIDTGWGQILDVELTQSDHTSGESKPTPEVIRFINLYKTAKYTIAGPLQLGAILAGAGEKFIRELGEFGEELGIAFQIRDDILDGELDFQSAKEALEYAAKAKNMIPKITSDVKMSKLSSSKMRKLLEEMIEFMVERSI